MTPPGIIAVLLYDAAEASIDGDIVRALDLQRRCSATTSKVLACSAHAHGASRR